MRTHLSILFVLVLHGKLISQEVTNLHYCNENIVVRGLEFFSDSVQVGYSNTLHEIYLIKNGNVVRDTFLIENDLIQQVFFLNKQEIGVVALNSAYILEISDLSLVLKKKYDLQPMPFATSLISNDFKVGWIKKKKKKGYVEHIFAISNSNNDFKEITERVKYRNKYSGSNKIIGNIFFDELNDNLILPFEQASTLWIYNVKNEVSKIFEFPISDPKKESWFSYFDIFSGRIYSVRFRKDDRNEIHWFDTTNDQLLFVKYVDHIPYGFFNNNSHFIRIEVDEFSGKKMVCHYLEPLDDTLTSTRVELLKEIKVVDYK